MRSERSLSQVRASLLKNFLRRWLFFSFLFGFRGSSKRGVQSSIPPRSPESVRPQILTPPHRPDVPVLRDPLLFAHIVFPDAPDEGESQSLLLRLFSFCYRAPPKDLELFKRKIMSNRNLVITTFLRNFSLDSCSSSARFHSRFEILFRRSAMVSLFSSELS